VGGGSTEVVLGDDPRDGGAVLAARSVDVGSVRLTERYLRSDPPTATERDEATAWVTTMLTGALDRLPISTVRRLVPVSGTATTVAAAALKLPSYDPARIHLSRITADQVHKVAGFFLGANRSHRAALGYMHPGRVDVIGGGGLILSTMVRLVAQRAPINEVTVSEHDILDGIALSLALPD